ncbi:tetratricopeptide repeat protein [Herpetosiphon sp. NSE202]|uniref:tetratricopeptide repeat protein n=1 Tax=Herpetosiphon sp. NSE202 TaxID=3351349 RepID=UPI0036374991
MKRTPAIVSTGLLLVALTGCGAPSAADMNAEGNALYEQGVYGQALNQYKEAALMAPDRPEPHVNLGNTRYQMGDYLGAVEAPNAALQTADPATQAIIYYNQGNAHFRLEELDEAIDAYKKTLRINPDDLDAKYNLELAQKIQEQQQQQQQQAQNPQDPNQPQPQDGQQDPNQPPQNGQEPPEQEPGGGQQPPERPEAPPSSISPDEAERQLDQLKRSEDRNREDLYDNYAVGADGQPTDNQGGDDEGW